jgi:hypothetical protein
MSFGFSIGDFLAMAKLVKTVWNKIDKSPHYINDARKE